MKELVKDPVLFFFALTIFASSTSLIGGLMSAVIMLITVALMLMKGLFNPLKNKSFLVLLSFYLIVFIYGLLGHGVLNARSFRMETFGFISMITAFLMSDYVRKFNNKQIRALFIVFFICILYGVVGTTYVGMINPMAVRQYGFGAVGEEALVDVSMYRKMGMMGYSLAHAMAVVGVGFSAIICHSSQKWLKVFSAVILFLLFRLLFVMTITTALILLTIGAALIFANKLSNGRLFITVILVVVFLIVFFAAGFSTMLLDFSEGANSTIFYKLVDVFSYIENGYGEGQVGYRQYLYSVSFKTFLSNPIFGWGTNDGSRTIIGEHSYLLDYLAYFGLFAFLLFVAWWKELKKSAEITDMRLKPSYYCCLVPVAGMVALKAVSVNTLMPFFSLFYLQILFKYLENERKPELTVK